METKFPLFSSHNKQHPIKVNIKITHFGWEKANKQKCKNKKRNRAKWKNHLFFRLFNFFPNIIYQFQLLFSLLPLTWHYSHHFTLQEWKSEVPFFLFEIFFNIFWQCLRFSRRTNKFEQDVVYNACWVRTPITIHLQLATFD